MIGQSHEHELVMVESTDKVCPKHKETYPHNGTCMRCAEEFWLIHDCITMGLYLNNRSWTGEGPSQKYEH